MRLLKYVLIIAVICVSVASADEPIAIITVEAGQHTRIDTPVCVSLDGIDVNDIILKEGTGVVDTQIEQSNPSKLWWILDGNTSSGEKRVFEVFKGKGLVHKTQYSVVKKEDGFLDIEVGSKKVLRYNNAVFPPPEGVSKKFARSGFIHPLWSPEGSVLTAIHPKDHIHHFGIWMPWTATEFEGRKVDFWNLDAGQGTVRFAEFLSTVSGGVFGGFQARQEHVVFEPNKQEKVALNEVWDVRVYNVGGPKEGYWLWDLVSTQRCATDKPVKQLEYRYGGLGFRATSGWQGDNCDYLTSEGKTKKDGHGTRAKWCDMFGQSGGKLEGVTIMDHPDNFRFPEPMRLWPADMNYIFFNYAPSQLGEWVMEPGKDYVFRYRFYVHEGKADVADINRLWYDFADPPKVSVKLVTKGKGDEQK